MTDSHPEGYKDFVAILLLHQVFAAKDILAAIEKIGSDTVTAEQIRSHIMRPGNPKSAVVVPDELQHYQVTKQNLARYDLLAKGVVH